MLQETLIKLFERDLTWLKKEIEYYADDSKLWLTKGAINNSPGNLCLHICGNLKYFIGAVLGNSGYVRDREKEFSAKNVPAAELLQNIDSTLLIVTQTIKNLPDQKFRENYAIDVFEEKMTTEYFLIHLITHLNYHLGQINYFRRLL